MIVIRMEIRSLLIYFFILGLKSIERTSELQKQNNCEQFLKNGSIPSPPTPFITLLFVHSAKIDMYNYII